MLGCNKLRFNDDPRVVFLTGVLVLLIELL